VLRIAGGKFVAWWQNWDMLVGHQQEIHATRDCKLGAAREAAERCTQHMKANEFPPETRA